MGTRRIPLKELLDYTRRLTTPQYEGDLKLPCTEEEIFWNFAREACRRHLWVLNKAVLIHPKRDRTYAKLHKHLCDWVDANKKRDRLIIIPRKHFKSTLITVGETIQEILCNPDISILIANKIHDMAIAFLSEIKEHFETNITLRALFPDIIPENPGRDVSKWSQEEIRVLRTAIRKDSTVKTIGMDGGKTGAAHDMEFVDDILDDDTVGSKDKMRKTERFLEMIQFLLNPGGNITYIGTRYGFNDLYSSMIRDIKENGRDMGLYVRRALEGPNVNKCIRLLEGKMHENKGEKENELEPETSEEEEFDALDMTAQVFKDKPIFPMSDRTGDIEFTPHVLKTRYLEGAGSTKETEVSFWNQMMNFPVEPKTQVFKRQYTRFWKGNIRDKNYRYVLCDPSLGSSDSSDYCVIMNLYVDHYRKWYVGADLVRQRLTPDEIIAELLRFAKMEPKPRAIGIENEAYQDTIKTGFERMLKEEGLHKIVVEPLLTHKRAKALRILQVQPRHKQGLIYFPQNELMDEILEEEFYRWRPESKNQLDDFCDCLAYGNQICLKYGYPKTPQEQLFMRQYREKHQREKIRKLSDQIGTIDDILRS